MGRLFWAIGLTLMLLLTACAGVKTADPIPTKSLVGQALTLEFQQTQAELMQQLRLGQAQSEVEITNVKIQRRSPLVIDGLSAYRVQGTYNVRFNLPSHTVKRRKNPYDIYLQRQSEGKTWRLARLQIDEVGDTYWMTQLIPPPTLE